MNNASRAQKTKSTPVVDFNYIKELNILNPELIDNIANNQSQKGGRKPKDTVQISFNHGSQAISLGLAQSKNDQTWKLNRVNTVDTNPVVNEVEDLRLNFEKTELQARNSTKKPVRKNTNMNQEDNFDFDAKKDKVVKPKKMVNRDKSAEPKKKMDPKKLKNVDYIEEVGGAKKPPMKKPPMKKRGGAINDDVDQSEKNFYEVDGSELEDLNLGGKKKTRITRK